LDIVERGRGGEGGREGTGGMEGRGEWVRFV